MGLASGSDAAYAILKFYASPSLASGSDAVHAMITASLLVNQGNMLIK